MAVTVDLKQLYQTDDVQWLADTVELLKINETLRFEIVALF